jgi:hypothetical protein
MQKLLLLLVLVCFSDSLIILTSSIDKVVKKLSIPITHNKTKNINKNQKTKTPTISIKDVIYNNFKEGYVTPTFETLKEAKNYFNYFNKDNCTVFVSYDVKKNDKIVKNWFVADTRIELYNFIRNNPNVPFYEQINVDKHKLFFDIDVKKGDNNFYSFNFIEYKECLEKELANVLNNKLNFVWLNSSSSEKHSYHLIVNNVSCNINENQQIKDYLNKQLKTFYLDNVYKSNQCLRLLGCSKYGQKRPLKLISKKCSFDDTLVNIYYGDKVENISAKIPLQEQVLYQTKFSNNIGAVNVPHNAYLMNNFVYNKYKSNVYSRKYPNTSLPCPICISPRELCKAKHHKMSDVYVFKKKDKNYMGCFRAKHWGQDRYFLNLDTNEVQHTPKHNIISPNIVSANTTYKNCNIYDVDNDIKEILNQSVNFGKYKGKQVKDLFKNESYVNYIISNFGNGTQAKQVCEKLINYFNGLNIPKMPLPKKEIKFKPTVKDMIETISKKTQTSPTLWENMSKKELEMHYSMMFRV